LKNRDLLANVCARPATNTVPAISLDQMDPQSRQSQVLRNSAEWNARANIYQQVAGNDKVWGHYDVPPGLNLNEGPIRPVWLGSTLVLTRRVALEGTVYVQGCWLNWTNLEQSLLASVRDLFPTADLQPVLDPDAENDAHRLAFLPLKLVTPSLVLAPLPFWSPSPAAGRGLACAARRPRYRHTVAWHRFAERAPRGFCLGGDSQVRR
jgi:hypothetical protein